MANFGDRDEALGGVPSAVAAGEPRSRGQACARYKRAGFRRPRACSEYCRPNIKTPPPYASPHIAKALFPPRCASVLSQQRLAARSSTFQKQTGARFSPEQGNSLTSFCPAENMALRSAAVPGQALSLRPRGPIEPVAKQVYKLFCCTNIGHCIPNVQEKTKN